MCRSALAWWWRGGGRVNGRLLGRGGESYCVYALGITGLALICLLALPLPGQHERTAVRSLLVCAGPIAGCPAVLVVRSYCGYGSLVFAFVVCTEASEKVKKTKTKRRKRKKYERITKKQSTVVIDPEKSIFARRQLQAEKGCGMGENSDDVLLSRRDLRKFMLIVAGDMACVQRARCCKVNRAICTGNDTVDVFL